MATIKTTVDALVSYVTDVARIKRDTVIELAEAVETVAAATNITVWDADDAITVLERALRELRGIERERVIDDINRLLK